MIKRIYKFTPAEGPFHDYCGVCGRDGSVTPLCAGHCEECDRACPHCGKDLEDVGIRIYYEAYEDITPSGDQINFGGCAEYDEALDAECGSPDCRGNLRKFCEDNEIASFITITYN